MPLLTLAVKIAARRGRMLGRRVALQPNTGRCPHDEAESTHRCTRIPATGGTGSPLQARPTVQPGWQSPGPEQHHRGDGSRRAERLIAPVVLLYSPHPGGKRVPLLTLPVRITARSGRMLGRGFALLPKTGRCPHDAAESTYRCTRIPTARGTGSPLQARPTAQPGWQSLGPEQRHRGNGSQGAERLIAPVVVLFSPHPGGKRVPPLTLAVKTAARSGRMLGRGVAQQSETGGCPHDEAESTYRFTRIPTTGRTGSPLQARPTVPPG